MEQFRIITEYSPWLAILCAAAGLLYAWALYSAQDPFRKPYRLSLAALRFLLVFFLCLLLLEPFVRQINNHYEKPRVVLAVDNSRSLPLAADSSESGDSTALSKITQQLDSLQKQLQKQGVNTDLYTLQGHADSLALPDKLPFDHKSTPLSDMLRRIRSDYENRNLQGVILLSDGIYNQGVSPDYLQYPFPIYTLGAGDTVSRKDLSIHKLRHNEVAYRGNSFPIKAEIKHNGFAGETIQATLKRQDKVLSTQSLRLNTHSGIEAVTFRTTSDETGPHHYTVTVQEKQGEFTHQNNTSHAYINLLESKKKVLIAAQAPHPDISAIRQALYKKRNYEVIRYIPGLDLEKQRQKDFLKQPFDVVIFHQIPGNRNLQELHQQLRENNNGLFYILGQRSNLVRFNQNNSFLKITPQKGQTDKVLPAINTGFDHFTVDMDDAGMLNELPPVRVPYGNYSKQGKSDVLLYQKVGNVQTDKPLLMVGEEERRKTAILTGTGYWKWHQQEYALQGNHKVTHTLMQKLVEYLATREDRRKFIAEPGKSRYFVSENIRFETEVYNDIYEPVYGNEITLNISRKGQDEKRVFTYVQSEGRQYFNAGTLPPSVYEYTATTSIDGEEASSSGAFIVRDIQMESLDLQARHKLLRQVSSKSGGRFFYPDEGAALLKALNPDGMPQKIHSSEEMLAAIHLKWLFFLLLGLATLEWVMRKLKGVT